MKGLVSTKRELRRALFKRAAFLLSSFCAVGNAFVALDNFRHNVAVLRFGRLLRCAVVSAVCVDGLNVLRRVSGCRKRGNAAEQF